MKKLFNRKIAGILFASAVLVLMLSVLTPTLGIKNNTIPTAPTNGYGYRDMDMRAVDGLEAKAFGLHLANA